MNIYRLIAVLFIYLLFINNSILAASLPQTMAQPELKKAEADTSEMPIFPVGINLGKRAVNFSVRVRGKEDGINAIHFENWLIPFDAVVEALSIKVTPLQEGLLELRSPGFVIRIDAKELTTDPELGLVFSIDQIQTLLKTPAEFNAIDYAIQLTPPWLGLKGSNRPEEIPVVTEGLPTISPPNFTLAAAGEKTEITGTLSSSTSVSESANYQGELSTVGTLFGGSWFVRFNQGNLEDISTWRLNQAQFLRQTGAADYVVGSQAAFWPSEGSGELWGFTTVQRFGFVPPSSFGGEGFDARQRLQANQVGRTISGEAKPGTLVHLVEGLSDRIVAEVLVDSSGIYRFEDVPAGVGNYRLLLYPDGLLSAPPEVRNPSFTNLPGQLSAGASALIASVGFDRQFSGQNNFLGDFNNLRGGVAYRRGLSEELTAGVGVVYDRSVKGLGEFFYKPNNIPLQLEGSVLASAGGDDFDWNLSARYEPENFRLNLNSDRRSSRFSADWLLSQHFSLIASGNSADSSVAAGFRFSQIGKNFSTFATATIDTENRLRWSWVQNLGALRLQSRGNEIGLNAELSYNLSGTPMGSSANQVFLSYETREADNLATLGWRYQSPQRTRDGRNIWSVDLGYGIGDRGNGLIASASTALLPGVDVRLRYQEVSATSDESTFRIELVPRFNLQGGITPADPRFERLRTRGGMLIQPFFDRDNNGKRHTHEKFYLEDSNLLLVINNKSLESWRPDIQRNGIFIDLEPGIYRLDLDPAGFPPDWSPVENAYAVEVVAGSYTPVLLPLTVSYTVTGVVTDAAGKVAVGARVEAVPADSSQRILSITNGAGVFYLEKLQQGSYTLLVNGQPAQPNTLEINQSSQPFQELNLQQAH